MYVGLCVCVSFSVAIHSIDNRVFSSGSVYVNEHGVGCVVGCIHANAVWEEYLVREWQSMRGCFVRVFVGYIVGQVHISEAINDDDDDNEEGDNATEWQ